MANDDKIKNIQEALQEVYDPEFPIVDIRTLGLIYDIQVHEKKKEIIILMTFTSPSCPSADEIQAQMTNVINGKMPEYTVNIETTFEPLWNLQMMKDPDLIRMFE